ncbi:hypothetical protein [Oceanirhabdus seepicola]|uniref:Uncharacterized protein n=1 Tax=Oceanirhabdus seepicola TaxID=2828781 RepID=A0A9J6P5G0_9CLOT|nr:hypothetical protein [Oceanirhabdus seepicola]MCM1991353.1 hypothetical protein [Oceanirhabdus seepicola]
MMNTSAFIFSHLRLAFSFNRSKERISESVKGGNKGIREKYSRKYAFSSKIECGFCGGTVNRRGWDSKIKTKRSFGIVEHLLRKVRNIALKVKE